MRKVSSILIMYIIGCLLFGLGIYFMKNMDVASGFGLITCGIVVCWTTDIIPEPTSKKYKLKEEHIKEILEEAERDSLERQVAFMGNERARQIIDEVSEYSFEDSLIALHTIETKYPNLVIGRGINL